MTASESTSDPAGAVQTLTEPRVSVRDKTVGHWEAADRLAAGSRLNLARRYEQHYDRLDAEFANLQASQAWLATQSNSNKEACGFLVDYAEVLASYLRQRGLNVELLRWCEDGLRAPEQLGRNLGWLLLLRCEAQMALGQWDQAVASAQAAVQASQSEDPDTYARAVLAVGRLELNQGDYEEALETLATAETLLSEQSDYEGLATARAEIAAYYLNRNELDKALSLYHEVDRIRRQAGATEASDHTLVMLGVTYRKKREYAEAARYLQKLLKRSEERRNPGPTATSAHHLAWVYLNQGDLVQARRLCGRAITLYEEIGDIRGASDAYEQLGLIALAEGQEDEAFLNLERSLNIRQGLGNQHGAASCLRHRAVVYLRTGRVLAGIRDLWESLALYWRLRVLSRQRFTAILRELLDWTVGRRRWTM